ncbi:MAG TPA: D-2-hydroxyacid dehydrogenase family protein [Burkholderiales bacterium]|nr:D-2-hydroxyacid dehydrogenase family protein [Burkholderiales bacterium]
MKIAVLDDYLRRSQTAADWSVLPHPCEITVFDRPIPPGDAARVLAPFDVVCLLRERMRFPRELIESLPNLKMIAATGLYNRTLDVAAANERGIVVSYTELRGTYRNATAELTWGLILAVARHIPHEAQRMRFGGWQTTVGITLMGRTLGLVGLGRQAKRVLPVAKALSMNVIAWSRNLKSEDAAALGVTRVDKDELFARSDVVSLHLVLSERSRGIVGARELRLMKPGAILVNTARGGLIDEAALIETLERQGIAGAGLDVYAEEPLPDDHPLRALPNVVLTPHQGHNVEEFYEIAYADCVENIGTFARGAPIRILTPERNQSSIND